MTLFESDPRYREKATIWRLFSLLPLFGALADGHVWRWFAINIPMDLGTGGAFTSDIDIMARLHDFPRSQEWLYRTWEVKVSLIHKDGAAKSLKLGKLKRTTTQLNAYRAFGSPDTSLLDVYLCEAGFFGRHPSPPEALSNSISCKAAALRGQGFGYQALPFEHGRDADGDVGLTAVSSVANPLRTTLDIVPPVVDAPRQPFLRLADHLHEFFEQCEGRPRKHFHQIVFCRECRRLQLISMKDQHNCLGCGADLIMQS